MEAGILRRTVPQEEPPRRQPTPVAHDSGSKVAKDDTTFGPDRPPEYISRLLSARAFDLAVPIPRLPASLQRTVNLMNMVGPNGPRSEAAAADREDADALALVPVHPRDRRPHTSAAWGASCSPGGIRFSDSSSSSSPTAVERAARDWLRSARGHMAAPPPMSTASSTDDDCDYEEPIPPHEQQAHQQRQLAAMAQRLAAYTSQPFAQQQPFTQQQPLPPGLPWSMLGGAGGAGGNFA